MTGTRTIRSMGLSAALLWTLVASACGPMQRHRVADPGAPLYVWVVTQAGGEYIEERQVGIGSLKLIRCPPGPTQQSGPHLVDPDAPAEPPPLRLGDHQLLVPASSVDRLTVFHMRQVRDGTHLRVEVTAARGDGAAAEMIGPMHLTLNFADCQPPHSGWDRYRVVRLKPHPGDPADDLGPFPSDPVPTGPELTVRLDSLSGFSIGTH